MRKIILLLSIFLIFGCQSQKTVYWCGDHPCVNKKEKEAYFKKNMIVEIRVLNKNYKKNDSEMEKIISQAKLKEKKRIKDEKDLAKQMKLEEKKRLKEEKDLTKQTLSKKEKPKKKVKLKNKEILITSQVQVEEISDFRTISEKIVKKNSKKSYPDINDMPE